MSSNFVIIINGFHVFTNDRCMNAMRKQRKNG